MKRLISLILCIVLLSSLLTGCNNPSPLSRYDELERILETAPEGEYDEPLKSYIDWSCAIFSDSIYSATDVIKAKYVTTKQLYPNYIHAFQVIENIRGAETESTIYVRGNAEELDGHSTHEILYEKGKNYLLLLCRSAGRYTSYDILRSVDDSLLIPLDDHGNPDIANSRICTYDLLTAINSEEMKNASNKGEFIEYFVESIKDNPYRYELPLTTLDTLSLLQESSHIIKVTIRSKNGIGRAYDRCQYTVWVTAALKGEFEIGHTTSLELPSDLQVGVGKEYILAGSSKYGTHFTLSNRNGVYDIELEKEIRNILAIS